MLGRSHPTPCIATDWQMQGVLGCWCLGQPLWCQSCSRVPEGSGWVSASPEPTALPLLLAHLVLLFPHSPRVLLRALPQQVTTRGSQSQVLLLGNPPSVTCTQGSISGLFALIHWYYLPPGCSITLFWFVFALGWSEPIIISPLNIFNEL